MHRRNTRPFPSRRAAGFTLVELMVAIVIIGLLSTVVMINVMPSQDRAMTEKARADISVLEQALETYRLDNLTFPDDLQALVAAPAGLAAKVPPSASSRRPRAARSRTCRRVISRVRAPGAVSV
mgnify:CR=1 FL=1